ncbi:autoinducer binding domain-containing protein [Pyruvatibacter sp.]
MDHQHFGEYIECLHGLDGQSAMLGLWSREMEDLGFVNQMYGLWSPGRQERRDGAVFITTYKPEWLEAYREENLALVDPVIQFAAAQGLPFTWNKCPIRSPEQANFMKRAASEQGMVKGIASTLAAGVGQFGAVSVSGPKDCDVARQMPLVYAMTSAMHAALLMQHSRLTQEAVGLTRRELEVFKHLPSDKSYEEIADLMNVSRRTVVEHASNIAEKLGGT